MSVRGFSLLLGFAVLALYALALEPGPACAKKAPKNAVAAPANGLINYAAYYQIMYQGMRIGYFQEMAGVPKKEDPQTYLAQMANRKQGGKTKRLTITLKNGWNTNYLGDWAGGKLGSDKHDVTLIVPAGPNEPSVAYLLKNAIPSNRQDYNYSVGPNGATLKRIIFKCDSIQSTPLR